MARCPNCWGEPFYCDDCYDTLDRDEEEAIAQIVHQILTGPFPPPDPSMDLDKVAGQLRLTSKILIESGQLTDTRIAAIRTWAEQAGVSMVLDPPSHP